jgi:hypothetical protein
VVIFLELMDKLILIMNPTLYNLKKIAASIGAKVELDEYPYNEKAFQIVAPDGKQWKDGNCVNMTASYWTYIKSGNGSKEDAIADLISRMKLGLEDYNPEING